MSSICRNFSEVRNRFIGDNTTQLDAGFFDSDKEDKKCKVISMIKL